MLVEKFQIKDEGVVMVTEVNCAEPSYPDKKTLIAILGNGTSQKF